MSATRSKPARTSASRRDSEFIGDLAAWNQANGEDNSDQIDRLCRNMRKVRHNELTPRQEDILHMYYDLGLTIPRIAQELGVHKSTISRTLIRGRDKLKKYLQYTL